MMSTGYGLLDVKRSPDLEVQLGAVADDPRATLE